jgi:hypothetical protein
MLRNTNSLNEEIDSLQTQLIPEVEEVFELVFSQSLDPDAETNGAETETKSDVNNLKKRHSDDAKSSDDFQSTKKSKVTSGSKVTGYMMVNSLLTENTKQKKQTTIFFAKNNEKQAKITAFSRQSIALTIDEYIQIFAEAIDIFIQKVFTSTLYVDKKNFCANLFFWLGKEYLADETFAIIIKAENKALSDKASINKKIISFFLTHAKFYGQADSINYLNEFRRNYLDSYESINTKNSPPDIQAKMIEFKKAIAENLSQNKTYAQLPNSVIALKIIIDDYIDGTYAKKIPLNDTQLHQNFKQILINHFQRIKHHFPATAVPHLALFAYKLCAVICHPKGAALPRRADDTSSHEKFSTEIAEIFIGVAARAGYAEAVEKLKQYAPDSQPASSQKSFSA